MVSEGPESRFTLPVQSPAVPSNQSGRLPALAPTSLGTHGCSLLTTTRNITCPSLNRDPLGPSCALAALPPRWGDVPRGPPQPWDHTTIITIIMLIIRLEPTPATPPLPYMRALPIRLDHSVAWHAHRNSAIRPSGRARSRNRLTIITNCATLRV